MGPRLRSGQTSTEQSPSLEGAHLADGDDNQHSLLWNGSKSFSVVIPRRSRRKSFIRNDYEKIPSGGEQVSDDDNLKVSKVVKILEETTKDDGTLWYRASFANGKVMEVCPVIRLQWASSLT
jgi:hypothetical protein